MKIMLADDDPKLHTIIKLWLTRNGHEMTAAANGKDALEILKNYQFDVLISDVNMPLMNGIELVKETLKLDNHPPTIIMLTSRCDLTELKNAVDSGHVTLFNKPFSPAKLIELIDKSQTQTVE